MHEAQLHDANSFLTLTYADEFLPPGGSLDVRHWQLFAKKMRKKHSFRYFHCGEYGDENGRPHYHAALFGLDFIEDRTLDKTSKTGHALYTSPTLAKLWPWGSHWIGELTFESAAYIARYVMKKQTGRRAIKRYGQKVDTSTGEVTYKLRPEYTTMSRNPGIAAKWIEKYMGDVYPSDQVITRGVPCRPPKFYDLQFEKSDPQGFKRLKALRRKAGAEQPQDWETLKTKATVRTARLRHHKRDL